jgi:hypothetical protein
LRSLFQDARTNHDDSQKEKKEKGTPESSPEIGVAPIRFTLTPKMVESCSEDEDDDDKDDEEEGDDDSVPPVPRKKFSGSSRVSRFSYNDKLLKLKCSEAFAQVEAWEEIDKSTGRYHDTFNPLAVVFTCCVRDNVSPLPYSDRMDGHHLKECLKGELSASRKTLNGPIDWMPKGDELVRTVLDRACLEVYANAGRVTQLSEMYVQRAVKIAIPQQID